MSKAPWHVAIYRVNRTDLQFIQQCGGTILNPKVNISAAHCFWNRGQGKSYPESEYRIAVGKIFRDLMDPREQPDTFRLLTVAHIHITEEYIDTVDCLLVTLLLLFYATILNIV